MPDFNSKEWLDQQAALMQNSIPQPEPAPSLADMIEPLGERIAVLVDTKSEYTPQGLFIPLDTARSIHEEKPTQGQVIKIGPDVDDVEVGDHVVFGKFTGTRIKHQPKNPDGSTKGLDPQTVIIMDERSVLCKLLTPEQAKNLKIRG